MMGGTMKRTLILLIPLALIAATALARSGTFPAQTQGKTDALDAKVRAFLEKHRRQWRDMNVPESDGRTLHDIVLKNGYTRALEIGTSTGHSGVWIAWALSKTGGKLITIDIDEGRHNEAVANFREVGLADYIDARLGDAHEIVPALPGPFDFVFSDADKDWYVNYAKAVIPKLLPGGCLATHNISPGRGRGFYGRGFGQGADYYEFMTSLPEFETSMVPGSSLAVSYKKK
jgi:caffeoyl-CoA O-methyltransferase